MTSPTTKDYLAECRQDLQKKGLPLLEGPDFKASYCDRCLQPGCSRSNHGLTSFELKTKTWQERLFNPIVLTDKSIEEVAKVASQNFLDIKVPSVTSVHLGGSPRTEWLDPLNPTPQVVEPPTAADPKKKAPRKAAKRAEVAPATPQVTQQVTQPVTQPATFNTPRQTGIILPGGSSEPVSRPLVADSWSAPLPAPPVADGVRVVKPGAKVRF